MCYFCKIVSTKIIHKTESFVPTEIIVYFLSIKYKQVVFTIGSAGPSSVSNGVFSLPLVTELMIDHDIRVSAIDWIGGIAAIQSDSSPFCGTD